MAEFGAAMVVFVCFVILPIIDISAIPVRYLITQGVLNELVQRVALAESRSEAVEMVNDNKWKQFLQACGVEVTAEPLKLVVIAANGTEKTVLAPASAVNNQWLPGGVKAPCVYSLELGIDAALSPLCKGSSGLPGFTSPVHVKLNSRAHWENLGRNPATHKYFINE